MAQVTHGFPWMHEIIPEGSVGDFHIVHKTSSEEEAQHLRMSALWSRSNMFYSCFEAGTYCILRDKTNANWMSDTYMERSSNLEVCQKANGHVLIAGLGIGLVLSRIVLDPRVESVTVVEMSPDVCSLVEPHLRKWLGEHSKKMIVHQGDIHKFAPKRKFDVIYFDIWGDICGDNYPETKDLHKQFRGSLNRQNPNHWMDSWMRWFIKQEYRTS